MEKIEKLVLLPSGPATKLGKVLFVEKYKMNVDNMDIMHMRTLIQDKNGKIGMYCYPWSSCGTMWRIIIMLIICQSM